MSPVDLIVFLYFYLLMLWYSSLFVVVGLLLSVGLSWWYALTLRCLYRYSHYSITFVGFSSNRWLLEWFYILTYWINFKVWSLWLQSFWIDAFIYIIISAKCRRCVYWDSSNTSAFVIADRISSLGKSVRSYLCMHSKFTWFHHGVVNFWTFFCYCSWWLEKLLFSFVLSSHVCYSIARVTLLGRLDLSCARVLRYDRAFNAVVLFYVVSSTFKLLAFYFWRILRVILSSTALHATSSTTIRHITLSCFQVFFYLSEVFRWLFENILGEAGWINRDIFEVLYKIVLFGFDTFYLIIIDLAKSIHEFLF